jgi:hypothetical protein
MLASEYWASDVPHANFWRSVDLNGDQSMANLMSLGWPVERADPFSACFSTTWYGYNRRKAAWKGMVMLTVGRPNRTKKIWGNLSVLDDDDGRWLGRVQQMYTPLLEKGVSERFGGDLLRGEPYGFAWRSGGDAICTLVNPGQIFASIALPASVQARGGCRLLFSDAGNIPHLSEDFVTLGPGQIAVVGVGAFAQKDFELGTEDEVVIPRAIRPLRIEADPSAGGNALRLQLVDPVRAGLRIVIRYVDAEGAPARSFMPGEIKVRVGARSVPVEQHTRQVFLPDRAPRYLPSWCVGEVRAEHLDEDAEVAVEYSLRSEKVVKLVAEVYGVTY